MRPGCKTDQWVSRTQAFRFFAGSLFFGLLCLMVGSPSRAEDKPLSKESRKQLEDALSEGGITPTKDGIATYLRELHPNDDSTNRLKKLIQQLGDEDFYVREAAMTELLRVPAQSPDIYDQATQSEDAEIRWRARQVLKQSNRRTARFLQSSFSLIRDQKYDELFSLVLDVLPFCSEEYVRDEAINTLKAIGSSDDAPLLQAALDRNDLEVKAAAIIVLEHLAGDKSNPDLLPFLMAEDSRLKLTAARALSNHGERSALPALVDLLAVEDLKLRAKSAETLRLLSGENFAFVAYDPAERREAARLKWVNWVADQGDTAKLNFPLPIGPVLRGHTLICNYSQKKIVELNAERKQVWTANLDGAWGCQGLPNGNRLATSYSRRRVVEFNTKGDTVWTLDNLPGLPYSAQRLRNGNTLITCSNNEVLEYSPEKKVVWKQRFAGTARDAQRLENGNTLVVLYTTQQVVEVDQTGKQIWKLDNMQRPLCAERLDNGNTLICQSSTRQLVEYDRAGTVVWQYKLKMSAYDAQRLPNGNTLMVGSSGALEIDPKGKTVWQKNESGMRGIHRF